MKFSLFSSGHKWPTITLAAVMVSAGITPLLARPDPPAADRLMDPSKPENQGAEHLFFHDDNAPATPPPPTASQQAFKDFKSGPATFEEFCKLNPLTGKAPGRERLTVEVLAAEVDVSADAMAIPAEPTTTMLSEGNLLRQQLFANSQAQTENVLMLDRQSDGTAMPAAWEGYRLFTCLAQTDTGYTLAFTFAESRVESWLKAPGSPIVQPVLSQSEMNKTLALGADGKWVALSGLVNGETLSGNSGASHRVRLVLYVRLVGSK